MKDRLPKYLVLKKEIIKLIEDGVYLEDTLVPSERELMEQYQVSRITVRRALEELSNAGYLYRVHGKGTFVKGDRHTQNLFSIVSCTEDIKSMGMVPSRLVVKKVTEDSSPKKRKKLSLNMNDKVFNLARIYYADDTPINYTDTNLPAKYFKGIETYDFEENSLYKVLEDDYNVTVTNAIRSVEAVSSDEVISSYLKIKEGTPLILFSTVTYGLVNGREVPIEYFDCYYHTDQFKFYINQTK
ncbi:transcriptional regulator [Candidatus Izimaplasma bacterium ZiA1]|uniref:GntR family transcriptional regulator n=1 Tax=Candidatus Izimoplasma sp. ZiA1 TaxID=2024899 RepID=UPI000BAA58A2|nr:transcriptional regulator [Candidatus Izimaplasma bacterium ZiA1]